VIAHARRESDGHRYSETTVAAVTPGTLRIASSVA
jgi:hypothetical protein